MQCSYPQVRIIDKRTGDTIVHACGRCRACRHNLMISWSFRTFVESLSYKDNVFLTLTYNDENLPLSDKGFPTLVKSHFQDFMKRMRYYVGKCRYYACGEYGEHTHRPHYHLILFGVGSDNPVFTQKTVGKKGFTATCKAWPFGDVFVSTVDYGSCAYCCKYMMKRKTGKLAKQVFDKFGQYPEFGVMSLRPGIGYYYLKKNETLIKQRGYVMVKGHKLPLSRYYIDKLFDKNSDDFEYFKCERSKKTSERFKLLFENHKVAVQDQRDYIRAWLDQQEVNLEAKEV